MGTDVGVCSFSEKNFESERISDALIREDFLSLFNNDIILYFVENILPQIGVFVKDNFLLFHCYCSHKEMILPEGLYLVWIKSRAH